MGDISEQGMNLMIDHIFGTTVYTFAAGNASIALGSAATDTTFTEVANANNYARVNITQGNWNSASGRAIDNSAAITFPTATGNWGSSPGFWGLFDDVTYGAGNRLAYGSITTPTAINNGDTPSFAANEINISFNANAANVGIGDIHANEFLDHIFGKLALSVPTIFVGFGDTNMTETDDIVTNELTVTGGYARVAQPGWDAAASSATENSDAIPFVVTGTWTANAITVFITDISAAGNNTNLLYFGKVTTFSAVNGDTVSINTGDLDVTIV